MRVSLITTGIMEFKGLAGALRKMFPVHDFCVEPDFPGKPFHGFTSRRVMPLQPNDAPGQAERMLRAALGTLDPEEPTRPASDFAFIVEDLELANKGNEAVVIENVRESAERTIRGTRSAMDPLKVTRLLRERVSFHLAVPMPESWFFGDLTALQSEVPQAHWPPRLSANRDLEEFLTDDPAYDTDDGSACVKTTAKGRTPDWVKPRRREHPKLYLTWLMRNPALADCSSFKEVHEGVRLLERLDYSVVLAKPNWFPYLRALARDLEAALGPSACGLPTGGVEAPLTSISHLPENPRLRNL